MTTSLRPLERDPEAEAPRVPRPAGHPGWVLPAAAAATLVVALLALAGVDGPLRPLLTLVVLGVVPGAGYAGLLRDRGLLARVVVSIGCSVAIVIVVAQAMLLLGRWSVPLGVAGVLAFTLAGLGLYRWRVGRWPGSGRPAATSPPATWAGPPGPGRRALAQHLPVLAGAVVGWLVSLPAVDLDRINDYGLVAALPPLFYLAMAALLVSFCLAVSRRRAPEGLLALHVVVLVVVVHATVPLVYDSPRYAWSYKHVGVIEHILAYGAVDRSVDIYHNWPGFFAASALFTGVAGLASALSLVEWSQLAFNLLDLAALVFVFRSLTLDRRLVWLGAWIFSAANWVGQDYFSPQAMTFFLSLVVFGVCLGWLRPQMDGHGSGGSGGPLSAPPADRARVVAVGIVLLLFTAVTVSHQLTPLVVVVGVTALVALGRCRPLTLPLAMALVAAVWFGLAYPFIEHVDIFESFGRLTDNAQVVDLAGQPAGRVFVVGVSRALTAAVWLLALVGVVRRRRSGIWRSGSWGVAAGVLAMAPFSTVVAGSYGGEILFRIYLFSLPWMAFLAAAAFYPNRSSGYSGAGATRAMVALTVVSSLLVAGLLVAHFGLERANRIRPGEVAAARAFYDIAPPGSLLLLVAANFPTRLDADYHRYAGFSYDPSLLALPGLAGRMLGPADVAVLADEMAAYPRAYLLFSRSQVAYAELLGVTQPGAVQRLERAVQASPRFRPVYRNTDASMFELRR